MSTSVLEQSTLHLKRVNVRDLFADPANVNTHDERNLQAITNSLRAFGQVEPLVVQKGTGKVIGGNGRLEALRNLGVEECDVVEIEANDVQATAIAIALNRTAKLSAFDDSALADTLKALQQDGLDLGQVGFEQAELDELLQSIQDQTELPAGQPDPGAQLDRAAELRAKWQTERGQLWLVQSRTVPGGQHRLLCGDSTDVDDLDRIFDGEQADLAVTSPPYNQKIDSFRPSGMHAEADWVGKVARLAYEDSLPEDEYQDQQRAALVLWYERLRDGASFFYNHKNRYRDKQVVSPLEWLPKPFKLRQEIVWSRPGSVTQNARMFLPSDERIYWLYKGDDFYFDDRTEIKSYCSVWSVALETNKDHAVAYPVELPTRCIFACSQRGWLVFDPYCGSGTTMVAAEQTGRLCAGMELEPKYVAVALERMAGLGLDVELADETVRA